jgi:SAM-dependent methyltransferase
LPKSSWEEQYRSGRWDVMRGSDELARYSVVAGYLHRLHPGGRVLDVGCGEGILLDHLAPLGVGAYTGIDLSEVAIGRALRRIEGRIEGRAAAGHGPPAVFVAADAERWQPPGVFDAVVFNECLYYLERPVDAVLRYRSCLAPGGTLVISSFRSRRAEAIRRRLAAVLRPDHEVTIREGKRRWLIAVYLDAGGVAEGAGVGSGAEGPVQRHQSEP